MQTPSLSASGQRCPQKILYALFWISFGLSGLQPLDRTVWFFNGLIPFGIAALLFLFRKRYFPSLPTALLLFLQGILLLLGAHYSFHQIPLLRITLSTGVTRSVVDWVVHFVDGLVYAAVLADLRHLPGWTGLWLNRGNQENTDSQLNRGNQLYNSPQPMGANRHFTITVLLLCFALSLLWEITEWMALLASGNRFLKNGGVMADTLIDVVLTLLGSLVALMVITRRRRVRTVGMKCHQE